MKAKKTIDVEEVLTDSHNPSGMNTQQFEGVIERPLSLAMFNAVGLVVLVVGIIFLWRVTYVQLVRGVDYEQIAQQNRLGKEPLFASRGVITDRFGMPLAWNVEDTTVPYLRRQYQNVPGLSHLLGFIRYPKADAKGVYWRTDTQGVGGLEQVLDAQLKGKIGYQLIEQRGDRKGQSSMVIRPQPGTNVSLTINGELQKAMGVELQKYIDNYGYQAAGGVIMNVNNGDVVALVSLPDFDANRVTSGDSDYLNNLFKNTNNPFLNRVTSGLFTPGSIVKPFVAYQALVSGIITPTTTVFSSGKIEVPNKYDPKHPSTFKDWKEGGHGVTDVKKALAESVNTFFYAIGGGYNGQKGMGIGGIETAVRRFGFGTPVDFILKTDTKGTIPSPSWKQKTFGEGWRLGDTYISAIGQFGFQVTPLQMVRAVAAIANNGILLTPRLLPTQPVTYKTIAVNADDLQVIKEGMRDTVTKGTVKMLDIKGINVAAKTGSAQVGTNKDKVNSWIIGFYPVENPQYAFALIAEKGPVKGAPNVGWAMRYTIESLQMQGIDIND